MQLSKMAIIRSGTPQFRITETLDSAAPTYLFYSQADLENDKNGLESAFDASLPVEMRKQIRTFDAVETASTGDVVFSLISGQAAVVQPARVGYLLTQNYALIQPTEKLSVNYLLYLINEDSHVKRQFHAGRQGSITMKYTLKQLNDVQVPALPSFERQELIGSLYVNQLRLSALKRRAAKLEMDLLLATIREVETK